MPDLANVVGLSALAPVVDIAIVLSLFACTLACINASARIAFTMAHDGMGVPALARAHDTHRTPHVAIWVVAVPMVLIAVVPVLAGTNAVELTGWVGTLATFGFMLAYALVALAAPVFLSRIGVTNPLAMITGAIGVLSMAFIFWANWLPQFIPGGAFTALSGVPSSPALDAYTGRVHSCTMIGMTDRRIRRLNVVLDSERAEKLAQLAETTRVREETLARLLLWHALDEADRDPRQIAELLDGIPGPHERAELALKQAAAGYMAAMDHL